MIIRFRLPPLSVLIYGSILLPSLIPLTILGGSLPPPSTSTTMPDTTLYLELVVNDRNFGNAVPISYRNNRYYLSQSQLRAIGLPISE
ncbi:fimbrial biogenesis outer membrane usher protein, partial [Yersinia pseudotuberculosis]|nr:fimbrial biogenesis outer membrane usher protein [Yersinia pseudotuberculosis]